MSYISTMAMFLQITLLILSCVSCTGGPSPRRRHRRDWLIPAKMLKENFDYKNSSPVARIRSDLDTEERLHYTLAGPGADRSPNHLFVVDENGMVYVTGVLDREECEIYALTGVAWFPNNTIAEEEIMIKFAVEDENDNPPMFSSVPPLSVNESSPPGTLVGTFTANDADKEGTLNSKISYSLVKQEPVEDKLLFYIDKDSGVIHVKENLLDRERQSFYTLTVKGVDMDGAPTGKSATGTVQVKVTDINDNVPTLEKDSYSAQIKENEADVVVLRIKALDDDEELTSNWLAEFDIIAGNEDGIFSISTDPITNEGILKLEKPVDFELNPDIQLGVVVSNVAPARGAGLGAGGGANSGAAGDGDGDRNGEGGGDMDLDFNADLGLDLDAGGGAGFGAGVGAGAGANAGLNAGVGINTGINAATGASGAGSGGGGGAGSAGGVNTGSNTGQGGATSVSGSKNKRPTKKKKRPVKGKVYAVNIAVENVVEGATFKPQVMPVQVSENPEELPADRVIAVYRAISDDTGKPADNVIYAKAYDPENLLLVDPDTAEIKLQKIPDRESPFVVNGTYYAKILTMTKDMPYTTSTGTLALQVGDFNDNCPTLTSTLEYVCEQSHVVNITGQDEDGHPNGPPLSFRVLTEKTRGKWTVQPIDGTRASLHSSTPFWTGEVYQIWIEVLDQQGLSCPEPQTLEVHVCSCEGVDRCEPTAVLGKAASLKESAATFGALGVGVVILALLALLVAVFLATCRSEQKAETFSEIPFFTEDHLMVYHTEGQGEDKDVALLSSPVSADPVTQKSSRTTTKTNTAHAHSSHYNSTEEGFEARGSCEAKKRTVVEENQEEVTHLIEANFRIDKMEGFTLPDVLIQQYYSQKATHVALQDSAPDQPLVFEFEGQGSPAGSVSACSSLGSFDDLQFLNDLELKFKTLAEICAPPTPPSPPSPSTPPSIHLPIASVAPTFSTSRNTLLETKTEPNLQTKLSSILPLSSEQTSDTSQASANHNSSIQSTQNVDSKTILQSPTAVVNTFQSQSAAQTPPLGQHVLFQQPQQPVYYITSPVLPPMHYMLQPQVHNPILFAGNQTPNLHGLVLLQNGTSEPVVHAGNPTWVMGDNRRKYGSLDMGEPLLMLQGGHRASVGRKGRRRSEGWVNSEANTNVIVANNGKAATMSKAVRGERKSQRRRSYSELSESVKEDMDVTATSSIQSPHSANPDSANYIPISN